MCWEPYFRNFFKAAGAKVKFGAIQVDVKKTQFPDLKLDTFPVPLEARIEPWLEREAHFPFSLGRLEMAQIYPSGYPQRPLKVLRPLCLKGLERSCRKLPGLKSSAEELRGRP